MEKIALTIPEAASAANLGRTSLYAYIKRGDLLAKKVGRKTIILTSELRRFLESLPSLENQIDARDR